MNNTGKTMLSLLIAAELALSAGIPAGHVSAAGEILPGTPYTADGSYDVTVPHIIVNQVYGGGDVETTGGYFSQGFIELFNPTATAVNLQGWSLQYSDPANPGVWSKLELTGTIQPYSSYLVTDSKSNPSYQMDISGQGDQVWDGILFNNKGMKVVLMSNTGLLTSVNPFADKPQGYVDMIGTAGNDNGSVIDGYELDYPTGKSEGTSKQKSVRRDEFTDTDNNKADFKQISFDSLSAGDLAVMKPHSSSDGSWGAEVPPLGVDSTSLPAAAVGTAYTATLSVYGGVAPYTMEAAGLPEGLTLNASTGVISGTPLEAGTATVTYSVYDSSVPPEHFAGSFDLTVSEKTVLTEDKLSITKLGGYSVGTTNAEGGVAEIVKYNADNGRFYLVNGSTHPATVDIVDLKDGRLPEKVASINIEALSETDGFVYGDLTSIDINTASKRIAVSVQEEDAMANGKILILNYDGELLATYEAGVQPDMIKYTADGRYILTADEAEPRTLEGDPEGSVTIVDTQSGSIARVKFDQPELIDDLVHIRGAVDPETKLITGPGPKEEAVRDLEPEFIALSEDQKTAYVSLQENNAIAAVDVASGKLLWVKGLGYKDLSQAGNALDLLKDGRIHLENVPFYGVYMPDGIAQYTVDGKTYLFTANEGDATEWDSKENASKVSKLKATLDQNSKAAVFLNSTKDYDDVEAMTDMGNDSIYMYGARSFSVWTADGDTMEQVYDSGSDFERITGERLPDYFNASNSNTTLDSRSTKKGPEPEYVEIGQVGERALAFVGLERVGGIMTYDVTNPERPEFVNYTNSREFTPSNNLNTDTGPEGIEFISAEESPTGLPLVLVANEVGGTVAIYQVNVTKITLDRSTLSLTAGGEPATLQANAEAPDGQPAGTLSWSSSDTEVATVDQNGKVTPLKEGTATVSVISEDGYGAAKALVTVAAAQSTSTPTPEVTPSPTPTAATGGGSNTGTATASPSPTPTPAATATAAPTDSAQNGNKITVTLEGATDENGTFVAPVTEEAVNTALEAASAASREVVFQVQASGIAQGTPVQVQIPAAAWSALASGGTGAITFASPQGSVSFDQAALAAVQANSAGTALTLTLSTGSGASYDVIGNRPVRELTLQAGGRTISSFGSGSVQVGIPYTAAAGEDVSALAAYYIPGGGQPSVIPFSSYNAAAGQLIFRTSHFSTFAVGYHKLSFRDTAGNFAEASITALAARGIITGVGEEQFAPKSTLSRGDAALLLARLAGADLNAGTSAAFQDVQSADYYSSAVAWAADAGIVNGTGSGKFAPRAQVTREQLAVMLVRLAEQQGWTLPASTAGSSFADQSAISAYAQEAVAALSQAGIISGQTSAGGAVKFAPQSAATRAETAHMLAAIIKLVQ